MTVQGAMSPMACLLFFLIHLHLVVVCTISDNGMNLDNLKEGEG